MVLHVGFVFQYKKKQKKLEVEIKNLEGQRKQIEEKFDEAITRGEEVDERVSNWLAEVEEKVQKIKDDNTINKNMQCFKFSCPDYISRYRMSKEAENKTEEVKNLTQSGNFSTVAHPKPFAQELQFPSSSANYANFESRELVFSNIMAALQDSNVKMIGVYGTGGIGKTTMVEEIGKQVKNGLFDEVVVAVVSQDANSVPITDGNKGCKIVITSQIRDVLEKMKVDRYFPMQILLEKEAWALFKKKVGNSVDSLELHDIADAICKECGGLPVAILAIGAALKDKKKYAWEDVLDQFKDSMLKNIAGIEPKVGLEYLFSLSCARGFPRLQRLRIVDCEMMEAIVGIEKVKEKDEDELSSQVINFRQLEYLRACLASTV
ncbi:disease resistance protein At4g27190-like [Camellia sinensis]|uniref:disease resistance protein At4g27190-like n=1 Tax=Camellia sinensis TaxID=4442 RepID=UPI001035DF4B|nr:disease resistance protein At4g27190-like [Camellia sinensis]